MVMLVRPLQSLNVSLPIEVRELGMVMLVRLQQLKYLQLFVYQLILIKTVEKRLCRFYRG